MQQTDMPRSPTGWRLGTTASLALALISFPFSVVGNESPGPLCPNIPVSGCEEITMAPLPKEVLEAELDRMVQQTAAATPGRSAFEQTGKASWYGPGFHGRKTASGVPFNQHAMTAAHRTLPMGTNVKVTNLQTGQTVFVRINDRGPYIDGRIIDLSKRAASELGMEEAGVVPVKVETLGGERPADKAVAGRNTGKDVEVAERPDAP